MDLKKKKKKGSEEGRSLSQLISTYLRLHMAIDCVDPRTE
jgi:hypothetical protein